MTFEEKLSNFYAAQDAANVAWGVFQSELATRPVGEEDQALFAEISERYPREDVRRSYFDIAALLGLGGAEAQSEAFSDQVTTAFCKVIATVAEIDPMAMRAMIRNRVPLRQDAEDMDEDVPCLVLKSYLLWRKDTGYEIGMFDVLNAIYEQLTGCRLKVNLTVKNPGEHWVESAPVEDPEGQ